MLSETRRILRVRVVDVIFPGTDPRSDDASAARQNNKTRQRRARSYRKINTYVRSYRGSASRTRRGTARWLVRPCTCLRPPYRARCSRTKRLRVYETWNKQTKTRKKKDERQRQVPHAVYKYIYTYTTCICVYRGTDGRVTRDVRTVRAAGTKWSSTEESRGAGRPGTHAHTHAARRCARTHGRYVPYTVCAYERVYIYIICILLYFFPPPPLFYCIRTYI